VPNVPELTDPGQAAPDNRPPMAQGIQVAALELANTLAGGVSNLARKVGLNADTVDRMLWGREPVPTWVFLRVVDYINEARQSGATPPGFPQDWMEQLRDPGRKP
jgi:hypothetical protein